MGCDLCEEPGGGSEWVCQSGEQLSTAQVVTVNKHSILRWCLCQGLLSVRVVVCTHGCSVGYLRSRLGSLLCGPAMAGNADKPVLIRGSPGTLWPENVLSDYCHGLGSQRGAASQPRPAVRQLRVVVLKGFRVCKLALRMHGSTVACDRRLPRKGQSTRSEEKRRERQCGVGARRSCAGPGPRSGQDGPERPKRAQMRHARLCRHAASCHRMGVGGVWE